MAQFPKVEEFAKEVAEKAMDEYKYEGKTLIQWVQEIIKFEAKNRKSKWDLMIKM